MLIRAKTEKVESWLVSDKDRMERTLADVPGERSLLLRCMAT